uniref:Uncharacterized protein n=1 Tax=Arundo donax TaxID=35708 RepID=A0A0A9FXH4_ARUDO
MEALNHYSHGSHSLAGYHRDGFLQMLQQQEQINGHGNISEHPQLQTIHSVSDLKWAHQLVR